MTAPPLTRSAALPIRSTAIAVGWFAVVFAAAALGVFQPPPGTPPIAIGLAASAPPIVAIALGLRSPRFRAWAAGLDLRHLTLIQVSRVGGLTFLVVAGLHALPAGFAVPAGLGDVAIGLTAPLIAAFAVGRSNRVFLAWTILGIADLVNAVTLGVLYSNSPIGVLSGDIGTQVMATMPMILIPAFGVPFTLTAHVVSLINLSQHRKATETTSTPTGSSSPSSLR